MGLIEIGINKKLDIGAFFLWHCKAISRTKSTNNVHTFFLCIKLSNNMLSTTKYEGQLARISLNKPNTIIRDSNAMLRFLYYSSLNQILATKTWSVEQLASSTFPLALWCSGSRRISSVIWIHSATFSGEMKSKTMLMHDCR